MPRICPTCNNSRVVERTIGGDGYGGRCCALADVEVPCPDCTETKMADGRSAFTCAANNCGRKFLHPGPKQPGDRPFWYLYCELHRHDIDPHRLVLINDAGKDNE